MAISLPRGHITGPDDLSIDLVDVDGHPVDAYEISYALYDKTTGINVLIGNNANRQPVRQEMGAYYAAFQIPEDANLGLYEIRWSFKEQAGDPTQTAVQEFQVKDPEAFKQQIYSDTIVGMIKRLRIYLRDNNPDRNYHFRPPTSEGTINQHNRVFSYIWTDEELVEYMKGAVDYINMWPPRTGFRGVERMIQARPSWREMIMYGAMAHAAMALTFNWVAEEFSVVGSTEVTVELSSGEEVTLPIEELHEICKE